MWELAIITDEVSHDFEKALDLIKEWGLRYVELRTIDKTNLADLDDRGIARVKRLLDDRGLGVVAFASPFLKCYLREPKAGPAGDAFFSQASTYPEHLQILKRLGYLSTIFGTKVTRCFSFWREDDPAAVFDEVVERLKESCRLAQEYGLILAMENENSCNGGTPQEVVDLVEAVDSPALGIMWDGGNAQWAEIEAYPAGYRLVRRRMFHVHVKDIVIEPDGSRHGTVMGEGLVDFRGMFAAMKADGYQGGVSLEPHFKAGEPGPHDKVKACVMNLKKLVDEVGVEHA